MLTYGDGVSNVRVDDLLAFHRSRKGLVTLTAVRPPADRVGRLPPAPVPRETEAGQPCPGRRGRRHHGGAARAWRGGWRGASQRYPGRLVAATPLAPTAWRHARNRARRHAQKAGRTRTTPTRAGARWRRLSTPRAPGPGSTADVLSRERARWHGARVVKKCSHGCAAIRDGASPSRVGKPRCGPG